jgi:hypothetical protein
MDNKGSDNSNTELFRTCHTIVRVQKAVKLCSFRLESSGVQEESVVEGRVKCHTARSMGLFATFTNEYRKRHASTGGLGVLQIPLTYNLMIAGAEATVFRQDS